MSARGHSGILFVVASTWEKLPFASIDVVLDTFAPRNPSEFHRITKPGATVLIVIPTAQHLAEARQTLGLLGIQEEKERLIVEQFAGRFALASTHALEYELTLDRDDIRNLIQMTPNFWHQSQEISDRVDATTSLQTTASFSILEFQRLP
jgi:23S rRNA (guanine745-N1)-methyltransferase